MATTTTSPNMNLPVPVPGEDPGPDWAENIVADMYAIDSHDHSSGAGVAITPSGLNINTDLPLQGNNLTTVKSVRFTSQGSPLTGGTNVGCIYESGVDLYFNDGAGNQVRMTQSGSVAGSAGTITGLPSGTASASFAGGTFTFQSATSTPATMAVGPLVIGRNAASSKTVTLAPNAGQASDYSITFPTALPGAANFLTLDNTGALSYDTSGYTGSGAVVLDTSPTITTPTITNPTVSTGSFTSPSITTPTFVGVPAGTITAVAFTPTITYALTSGSALTLTTNTTVFYYQRIGNVVSVNGSITGTITGYSSGTSQYTVSSTIPVATAALAPAGAYLGRGSIAVSFTSGPYWPLVADSTTGVKMGQAVLIGANQTYNFAVNYSYIIT